MKFITTKEFALCAVYVIFIISTGFAMFKASNPPAMANEQIISVVKQCEEAGLSGRLRVAASGIPVAVVCVPKGQP
jgi:hypothetical protein